MKQQTAARGTKFELKFPIHKNNGNKLIITKQG